MKEHYCDNFFLANPLYLFCIQTRYMKIDVYDLNDFGDNPESFFPITSNAI